LAFIYRKHYAYVNWETKEYDFLLEYDNGVPGWPEVHGLERHHWDPHNLDQRFRDYWSSSVPEANKAEMVELRVISYDRISALDEIGDIYHPGPHLLVEYKADGQPFEPNKRAQFFMADSFPRNTMEVRDGKCISYFPEVIRDS
jgi:hypothetical protein